MKNTKLPYLGVIPSLVENTSMYRVPVDGEYKVYEITPNDGYLLHVKGRDYHGSDPVTGEEIHSLGYTEGSVTCPVSYDFEENPQEFYAVLKEENKE